MLRGSFRSAFFAAFGFLLSSAVFQQAPAARADSDKTLRELLDEVRLLRQVLQETSVGSLRAQILLTQRQSHDERAAQVDRLLSGVRSGRDEANQKIAALNDQVGEYDRVLTTEADPDHRNAYEAGRRQVIREREQLEQNQQRSVEREQDLAAQLDRERAEVDTIQKELDRIESDLAKIQKDRPSSEPK